MFILVSLLTFSIYDYFFLRRYIFCRFATVENLLQGVPKGTQSLVLIVDDPDAPMGTFLHWLVWNINPDISFIEEKSLPHGAMQGRNDFGKESYGGPCPPSGTHRYFFKVYALDKKLDLPEGSKLSQIQKAIQGHITDEAQLIGLYQRK